MFVLYKPKVAPIQLNRSCSMHKWAVQKGKIQESVSKAIAPITHYNQFKLPKLEAQYKTIR